eukprot:6811216-Ditylum_brightwellii.AAC.1
MAITSGFIQSLATFKQNGVVHLACGCGKGVEIWNVDSLKRDANLELNRAIISTAVYESQGTSYLVSGDCSGDIRILSE